MGKLKGQRIDSTTRDWIRNASDELAAQQGARFELEKGRHVINWWKTHLRLYEGEHWAGKPFEAHDWQDDCMTRIFGWQVRSEHWSRLKGYDVWVRRFRYAIVFVPKKNKKSPTLAAAAIYVAFADGELGNKAFLCARDGLQAREIAGRHVCEMVNQSPTLSQECVVHRATMKVQHGPTKSMVLPISSRDVSTQKGKEGLNGSVFVDEVHVVDRSFMKRMSRAGISKPQPLQLEVSTAGDDPEGYGRERYEYGQAVVAGAIKDTRTFFASYEAPQDLGDEELASNPLKYGRLANPAMGHTVDPEEFLADYNSSKASRRDFANFKMYRLNIWQSSSNPFLDFEKWKECGSRIPVEAFRGLKCVLGMDLSRTRDMTALVLAAWSDDFRYNSDHEPKLLTKPFLFLPHEVAAEMQDLVDLLSWGKQGFLELQRTECIDFGAVEAKIHELHELLGPSLQAIIFDKIFADDMTQRIEDQLGIARYHFPQTITHFALPTAELERMVLDGTLRHDNNPVQSWQAQHVTVHTDANQNMRPVKPSQGDWRKIDGIVALIMAIGGVMSEAIQPSVYETKGVEIF